MAYTALYRKLRPQTFAEVIGQEAIVQTLKNQVRSGRLSHAYLFTGTRGTGKTSTAKIFARAVNCLNPQDGEPCNQCENCHRDLEGRDLNIMEIDAASNNGVDNIRELREDVRYQPAGARYKIYIIDEVHMLSTGAFNALLKTLEEPPAHAMFILATTDPHKVPDTILSRCQRYDFRRIAGGDIQMVLQTYLNKEGIAFEEKALRFIAKTADGALRDAHSILDRCLAFYLGEELTLDKVLRLLGAVDSGVYEKITAHLLKKEIMALLTETDEMLMQGRDLQQLVLGEINYLRDLLIVKTMPQPEKLLDLAEENLLALRAAAELCTEDFLMYIIKSLSQLEADMRYESNKRILLELEWIKLCRPEVDQSEANILRRLTEVENRLAEGPVHSAEPARRPAEKGGEPVKAQPTLPPIETAAFPEDIKAVIAAWPELHFALNPFVDIALEKATPFYAEAGGGTLLIVIDSSAGADYIEKSEYKERIAEFLAEKFQKNFNLQIISVQEYENRHKRGAQELKNAVAELRRNIDFEIEMK